MKKYIFISRYELPQGEILLLGDFENQLCMADWLTEKRRERTDRLIQNRLGASFVMDETPLHLKAKRQLDAYFRLETTLFDLPILMVGSEFQKSVWKTLLKIPYGQTWSYAQEAKVMGRPSAVRAVANANGANPISIIVPCHRVIGSNRTLTGYGGGLAVKEYLINLEKNNRFIS